MKIHNVGTLKNKCRCPDAVLKADRRCPSLIRLVDKSVTEISLSHFCICACLAEKGHEKEMRKASLQQNIKYTAG